MLNYESLSRNERRAATKLARKLLRTVPAAPNLEGFSSIRWALNTAFMKPKKLYQDLTIDQPLPHDPVIEAEVDAMTPEQTKALFESSKFGLRVLYRWDDALAWAQGRLSTTYCNTSEKDARAAS